MADAKKCKLTSGARLGAAMLLCFLAARAGGAENPPAAGVPGTAPESAPSYFLYATRVYEQAQQKFQVASNDATLAWQLGRACADLADAATNDTQCAALAQEGINASRQAIARQSNSAAAHYYLGVNLGQWARVKKWSALKSIGEMERAFEQAAALDAKVDYAGPDRCLGLLYRDAPGWPLSVGSNSKARKHLAKAAELVPDFPENQLNLLESYLKWGERKAANACLPTAEQTLEKAKSKLTGPAWTASWRDWNHRLAADKKKLQAK